MAKAPSAPEYAADAGSVLARFRARARLSQSKLAERADFDHSYISRIECGDRLPTRDALERLAEAMGLTPRGQGARAALEGWTQKDGRLPVNPSGGLKAKGHPLGATGAGQAVEVFEQLTGLAGARAVRDARIALTHNVGGSGATCAVHVWEAGA